MLGITSDVPVGGARPLPLTELDQEALFRPLTKWNTVIDRADQVPQADPRAPSASMTTGRPGAAHIGLPFDVQKAAGRRAEVWADSGTARFRLAPRRPGSASIALRRPSAGARSGRCSSAAAG